MEKYEGNILENVSDTSADFCHHIFDIASLLSSLGDIPLSQYGSIYCKEDVDPLLQAKPLYAEGQQLDDCSERLRIGSSVERHRDERARLLIDRGPCKILPFSGITLIDVEIRDGCLLLY
jgi:hypothetical protein